MKKISKTIIAVICAFAVCISVLVLPASAVTVNYEEVVQSWSFEGKGLNDSEVNVITNNYWDNTVCKVTRTVENGVYTVAAKTGETMNANTPIRIYFKLNESLIAEKEYTFTLNAYSPSGSRFERGASVYYATKAEHNANIYNDNNTTHALIPSAAGAVGTVSKDAQTILSTSTDATIDFTFTATEEMVAGGYIGFAAKVVSGVTGAYCFKGAKITTTTSFEANYLDENGDIFAGSWSFEGKGLNDSEVNVTTNDYWDNTGCKVTRTVENGVYTVAAKTGETMNANTPIRIYFKLNESLIAEKEYTFTLNAYSPSGSRFERGASVFYATSVQHDQNIYINTTTHPLVPSKAGAVGTVSKDAQTILSTSTDATIDFTFTATEEMVAGGYIGFAAKVVSGITGAYCFKGAKLVADSTVSLVDYDFSDEDVRTNIFQARSNGADSSQGASNTSDTYVVSSGTYNGKTVIKKYQYGLLLAVPTVDPNGGDEAVVLEKNTEYIVDITAACANYSGGNIHFCAGDPNNFNSNINIADCLIETGGSVKGTMDGPATNTFTFTTAGSNIDFATNSQLLILINPIDTTKGNQTICYKLSVKKRIKGLRMKTEPVVESVRYNKVTLANDSFATYAIYNSDSDEFEELDSNISDLLDYDTTYTFKAKYADNGRYYLSDYGDEITVKTLKFGDVNTDETVDIRDLVSWQKGFLSSSSDDIYDLDFDDGITAGDIIPLIDVLLGRVIDGTIAYNDPSAVYTYYGTFGETEDGGIATNWSHDEIKFDFEGSAVQIQAKSTNPVKILLDGEVYRNKALNGSVWVKASSGNQHTVSIVSEDSELIFNGVKPQEGTTLSKTADEVYVRFIGDSITYANPGYSHYTAEKLGVAYSVQARPGMSLVDGWGWYEWDTENDGPRPGMESSAFLLGKPGTSVQAAADLSLSEQPDVICIFLGTNDYLNSEENLDTFADHMLTLVQQIKSIYPDSRICMLQALTESGSRKEGITRAYNAVVAEYPNTVFVPSDTWNVEISSDGTHPTQAGYKAMGDSLYNYLIENDIL